MIIGVVVAIAIVVVAPYLAPGALALLGTASATALALAVTTAIIGAALAFGATMLMKAMGLTQGAPRTPAGPPTVFRQSIADSFIVYGKRRVGGLMVFFHPRISGSDHYRYFVIACAGHRCQGATKWFLGDEEVTVDGSNKVTSGVYADSAWLWFQRGLASETANATFVSECGGKWTSAHKGNGIAAIYAKFKMTDAVVQAGMPNIGAEIEGKDDILDPRDASTGYTNNGALVFYDWMALPREEGGFGAYADEIPDDDWISAQANVCDEVVEAEARYALDGVIVTGAPPSEIRDVLVVNMAGTITYSGGKHLMRPGYWVPSTATLTEGELSGPIQVQSFLSGDEAANEVQGSYVGPDDGYQSTPFPTQTISAVDIRQMALDLAFVTSPSRAQRVARIMLKRAQCEIRVVWPMTIAGLAIRAMDTVQLDTTRYGLSNYAFTVGGWSLTADFGVVLNLREENADIYEDVAPVTSAAAPSIAVAETIETTQQAASLIASSSTRPTRVLEASESGGVATVTVIAHDRVYKDGVVVAIPETVFPGLVTDTPYFPYYVDITRSDTAPAVIITDDSGAAQLVVGSHALGRIRTPITASGVTYVGGGAYEAGATVGREIDGPLP